MTRLLGLLAALVCFNASAQSWVDALRKMPHSPTVAINRSNCMARVLQSLQPNKTVKGIVFLPAVSDDFYLINRDAPALNLRGSNLFEVIYALTNSTKVQATFARPLLLLHLPDEPTVPRFNSSSERQLKRLNQPQPESEFSAVDTHWERLQPRLTKRMGTRVRPKAKSQDAWHFARHNLAGSGLTDLELLKAISLAGDTEFSIKRSSIEFRRRTHAVRN